MEALLPESDYQRHLSEGRFMLQRSRQSGAYVFYPRVAEPGSGRTDLEWVQASGRGVVYSTTVVRQRPPTPHYNVALIDLAEGVRMMSRVEGVEPDAVTIGQAVQAKIVRDASDVAVVIFEPV